MNSDKENLNKLLQAEHDELAELVQATEEYHKQVRHQLVVTEKARLAYSEEAEKLIELRAETKAVMARAKYVADRFYKLRDGTLDEPDSVQ